MTSPLQDLLERHVATGTVPGVVASLGTSEAEIASAGAISFGGAPIRADAIFRIQSMTKAMTADAWHSTIRSIDGCPSWRIHRC